ncbi:MAG: FHA domain-containing protein, partial [Clostridiales bacterium]|nr:FHA domain-containing protein [Clostridiales bacterium]
MYVLQSAQLIILEPNSPLKTYTITDDQVIIGRAGGANNLSLFSHFVSSQHCIISAQGSGFILSDLASLNGTYVNSKQLKSTNSMPTTPVPIHDGDVISIGDAMSAQKVFILFSTTTNDDNFSWKIKTLIPNSKITVGRDVKSDICVPNITAS